MKVTTRAPRVPTEWRCFSPFSLVELWFCLKDWQAFLLSSRHLTLFCASSFFRPSPQTISASRLRGQPAPPPRYCVRATAPDSHHPRDLLWVNLSILFLSDGLPGSPGVTEEFALDWPQVLSGTHNVALAWVDGRGGVGRGQKTTLADPRKFGSQRVKDYMAVVESVTTTNTTALCTEHNITATRPVSSFVCILALSALVNAQ